MGTNIRGGGYFMLYESVNSLRVLPGYPRRHTATLRTKACSSVYAFFKTTSFLTSTTLPENILSRKTSKPSPQRGDGFDSSTFFS